MKHLLTAVIAFLLLTCCTTRSRYVAMRAGLDSINHRNRTDQPFLPADVQPFVDYFDRHGTSNDQMLAHYLLGRAYHEQGEAPMALQCYQDAADRADTTAADCDYAQLCRVYGQMAGVFYQQSLYDSQLIYDSLSMLSAWKAKDTLAALMSYEQFCHAYRMQGKDDQAIAVIERVSSLYSQYGYPSQAAIAWGNVFNILIKNGDFEKAKKHMRDYETATFDSLGCVVKGREAYYYFKGLLYLKQHYLDTATYWFRKELSEGKDFNNQNGGALGLAMTFELQSKLDSASKYYHYAYAMNDSGIVFR